MLKPISRVEEIFRDTTVHKSETTQIDEVTSHLGFDRPPWLLETNWRKAVSKTAFGPRGSSQTLFLFLRYALDQFAETFSVVAGPNTFNAVVLKNSNLLDDVHKFTNRHKARLCVLINNETKEELVLYSTGGKFLNPSNFLQFEQFVSHIHEACPSPIVSTTTEFTLKVLPFLIFELTPSAIYPELQNNIGGVSSIPTVFVGNKKHANLIRVRLFNTGFKVPGTFIQFIEDMGDDLPVDLAPFSPPKSVGGPTGGYLMEGIEQTQYNDGNEQAPIYLGEGLKNIEILLEVLRERFLAAGVRIEFEFFPVADF